MTAQQKVEEAIRLLQEVAMMKDDTGVYVEDFSTKYSDGEEEESGEFCSSTFTLVELNLSIRLNCKYNDGIN